MRVRGTAGLLKGRGKGVSYVNIVGRYQHRVLQSKVKTICTLILPI